MPYLCPQCDAVYPRWNLLKGHLVHNHKAQEFKESTKEQIEEFAITEEEAKERKRQKTLGKAGAITEIPSEPVERLHTVLQLNGVDPEVAETVVNIFRLNPRWWGDPYQLDSLLRTRVKPQATVVFLVKQYIDGVDIPQDTADRYGIPARHPASPYYPGGEGGRGGEYGYPRGGGSEPVTHADMWADRERQRLERELDENRRKLGDLESKLHSAMEPGAGSATETKTMTIADEHGNPMVIPYDPMLMEAIRREQEARARKAEREEMMTQMAAFTGKGSPDTESLKDLLKPFDDALKEARGEVAKLREDLQNQRLEALRKETEGAKQEAAEAKQEAREAKEMAAAGGGEGKGLLDYAGTAGAEARDALDKVAKDIRGTVEGMGDKITSVLTGARIPPRPRQGSSLTPSEVADIMEVENRISQRIGG